MTSSIRLTKTTPMLLITLLSLWSGLVGTVHAQLNPPPDGGYQNGNTAEGTAALYRLTTGSANTAVGNAALFGNSTGNQNTAVGYFSLFRNTGDNNTAVGYGALANNSIGYHNTAVGWGALLQNTTGRANVAAGSEALYSNTTGHGNTAYGIRALYFNASGYFNTAIGNSALRDNTTGYGNLAVGNLALALNTSGYDNTAIGNDALRLLDGTTDGFNLALGSRAGANLVNGSHNVYLSNEGQNFESNTMRIGGYQTAKTFVAGIRGVTLVNGLPVVIGPSGQLGTQPSSRRLKTDIEAMDNASQAILALKPVTFRYKADAAGIRQFGLIAEDVAAVNSDLVVRDDDGEIYTVRYDAVNGMLLNEFLKEHAKVEQLESKLREHEMTIAQQRREFEAAIERLRTAIAQQQNDIQALTLEVCGGPCAK